MKNRYLENRLSHLLENYIDFATYELEINGGFGIPDPLVFSIHGASFLWNRFYYAGARINSLDQGGRPLHLLSTEGSDLSFDLFGLSTR
ncbi:MAG: hypothetical protein JNM63_18500, partial [Spirochaetia bacterium]|nr:hypothetical protein [Spirochaetia bacterium]